MSARDADAARELFARFAAQAHVSPRKAAGSVRALKTLARKSRDVSARAWAAFAAGALAHLEGRVALARAEYREAAALHARAGAGLMAGEAWKALVEVEKEAGNHAGALAAFRRADAIFAKATTPQPQRRGELLMNLGNAYHHADRHREALDAYTRARRLLVRGGNAIMIASCDYNRANILSTLDRIPESRSAYESARQVFDDAGLDALVAQAAYALAGLDVLEGRLDDGLARLLDARHRHESLGDAPGVAHAELDAADALLRLNRPSEAAALAAKGQARFRKAGQAAEVATACALRGGAALQEGRAAAAVRLFRAASVARRKAGNVVAAALSDIGLAGAEMRAGRPAHARRTAAAAARVLIARKLASRGARALAVVAEAALAQGDVAASRKAAMRACALARGRDARVEMAALLVQARCEERAGRGERAHALLRRAAVLVERMRLGVSSEESQLAFALDKSEVFEALVANRLARDTDAATRQALQYAERGKARALAERLSRGNRGPAATPATREALRRLEEIDRKLAVAEARLEGSGGTSGLRSQREAAVQRLVAERSRVLADIGRRAPGQGLSVGAPVADTSIGIAALAPGEIALEYVEAEGLLHLFVIESGRVEAHAGIARVADVRDLVDLLRFQLGKGVLGDEHAARHAEFLEAASRRHLEKLFDVLIGPVASRIEGRAVRVVPHGILHGLPFHALERDGRALVERAIVSHAPSLAVLGLLAKKHRTSSAPPLVLGVPDHAAPEIEAEVSAIQRRMADARVFRGAAATTDALRLSEDGPSILHVACHGFFAEGLDSPGALRLGDAWLSLPDLHALRGTGDLVVLSGCETGRGMVHAGDEWVGLVRGFLLAGARCVVASLWEVHDRSTVQLMDDFYANLGAGMPVGEALASSQRAARRRGAPLLHWAPFVAVGDPRLRLERRRVA